MNKKLNKEQVQAIKHGTGPLLIIAGAGTGKTTVITERVKYLIEKKLAKPEEILALTFTEKAAKEMEERIDIALDYGQTNMWIMTFHSFCEKILRQNALHVGLDPKFKLTSEAETVQLIRNNLFSLKLNYFRPLGNPNKFIGGMIQHFSRLQDEDIKTDEYLKWASAAAEAKADKEKWLELANAYKTYEELKTKNGYLDFGDLITKTLKLLRDRPNILKEYKEQFKYILIDEFQDTNYAQNQLAILLSNKQQNINVVGDDDQSVYRFRGAAVSNIIQFRKNFSKTKVVVLTKNYRSTQEILDRSYDLIQHNNPDRLEVVEKIDKKLVSARKEKGEKVEFIHVDRVENEADEVVKEIVKLANLKKYNWSDFAILVRANNHSEPFNRALDRAGIPYQFLGPGRLFKQPEVIDLISYLKVLYNFSDSTAFYRILTMDEFKISGREIAKLGIYARKYNVSLFEAAEQSSREASTAEENLSKLINMIHRHLGLIAKENAGQILYYFLEESEILKNLANPEIETAEKRANNISKFFDKLKTFETDHPDSNLFNVVDWLDLSQELGESPLAADSDWSEVNAVNLMSVHSAKGLEFPVVFLVNLVSQRFPTTERHEQIPIPDSVVKEVLPKGNYHEQEERRLFYVGMTRAKDKLYLTAANYYGEGKRDKKLSPFIAEAIGKESTFVKTSEDKGKSFMDFEKNEIVEEKEAKKKLEINYLSYSQIETFKVCPLHYKLRYILKIPTQPTAPLSFGIAIHNTLKNFYEEIKDESTFVKTSTDKEKLILKLFKNNWINEGFDSKAHEEKFIEKGKKFLKEFLKKNPIGNAKYLEEPFLINCSSTSSERPLKVGGKIDRVDELPDGSIEIWDYKTGANVPTQKEVDKNLQLTIYALAFDKKPEEIKLSLYYFETQTKITTTRNASDLIKAKEEILKVREEIEKSDFKCNGGFLCQNCEYKLLCNTEE
ncbi:hypothetical protein BH10PAT1_BH10PAT1_2060 [soil metagenome]